MGKYFGTDGFRGEAGKDLTAIHAYKIGRYLGYYYGKEDKARVVIGKDTRRSSYMLEYALVAGLCASGADAYLLHVTTTPSVAYVTRCEDFDAGIMISASHNPFYDNGIKIINSRGEKMSERICDDIENFIDSDESTLPFASGADVGRTVDYVLGRNRYTGYIISLSKHSYSPLRIGLDSANGATWMLAKSIFEALGAKTYVIGNTPDGTNINDSCGSTHIEALCELVKREGLDIGFAFDGDADRCLAVNECGEVITGDGILYLSAKYMKARGELNKNTVVTTVMSNYGLYKALERENINYIKTDVGDRFVFEEMKRGGYSLGGEESGHIIYSKLASTGDGLITAIKIMEALIESKQSASHLTDGFYRYPQITKNLRVADKDAPLCDENVKKALTRAEKMLSGEGRILLRKSGTEPLIRIMAESKSEESCRAAIEEVEKEARKYCV